MQRGLLRCAAGPCYSMPTLLVKSTAILLGHGSFACLCHCRSTSACLFSVAVSILTTLLLVPCSIHGARQHKSTAYPLTTSWALLQESELQQLTELHSQLQRYHAQCSGQQAALASIASAAAGALRQLQPSQSLTSSADSGSAQHTLDPKSQVDLSLALAEPVERSEDAQALMQQLLAALSEGQHAAAERQRALTQQVSGSRAVLVGPRTADRLCYCLICTSEACHWTWTSAMQRLSGLMLPLRPCWERMALTCPAGVSTAGQLRRARASASGCRECPV